MKNLLQWTPCIPIQALSFVGTHVRIDPLDLGKDVDLLWRGLSDDDDDDDPHEDFCPGSINARLKWFGLKPFQTSQDLKQVLEHIQETGGSVNVFRLVPSNQVVGMASYIGTVPEHGVTEVGYVAHGPKLCQTRAATEAHYLLAKHAFETMGYRRYEWKCNSCNEPSRQAALRLGFQYEGCFRQHRVTQVGENRDTSWFSMLDSEWPLRKAELEAWLSTDNFDESGKQRRRLSQIRESSS